MTNPNDRLFPNFSKHRKSPPGGDSQNGGFFQTGQGGRTVLPPLSSAFPTSPSSVPVPNHPSYSQQRSSPGKTDHGSSTYSQWPTSMPVPQQQHSSYYEQYERYHSNSAYPDYPSRNSPTISSDFSPSSRKLPPLSTEKYQSYGAVGPHVSNPTYEIRSPTAGYPPEYTSYQSQSQSQSHPNHPIHPSYSYPPVPDPRHHPSQLSSMHHLPMTMYPTERGTVAQVEAHGPSPYSRMIINSRLTEEPTSIVVTDEPAIKKKRKRADAAQLKVLDETYARTAFPSTEERAELAKKLDMSARSVQIWFQNKRQSMRQTTRQSSTSVSNTHQSFNVSPQPDDHSSFTAGSISPTIVSHSTYASRSSQDPRSIVQESRSSTVSILILSHRFHYPQAPRDGLPDDTLRPLSTDSRGIVQRGTESADASAPNGISSMAFYNTFPGSFSHPVSEISQGGTTPGDTQHQATYLMANDYPVPANDQVPVSPTGGCKDISACGWDDGGGPCGMMVHKDGIAEHMRSFHVKSRLSSESAVKCLWKGCRKTLRRDTIFRHILETHYKIRRSKSEKKRTVSQQIAM